MMKWSPGLLIALATVMRAVTAGIACRFLLRQGWRVFAVDGSRIETPRTVANQAAFGCAGRDKSGPQMQLTLIRCLATGLPWAWKTGPGADAERTHLRDMLDLLPPGSLLLADAGFTGYDLFEAILAGDRHFLIRVGANVRLPASSGSPSKRRATRCICGRRANATRPRWCCGCCDFSTAGRRSAC